MVVQKEEAIGLRTHDMNLGDRKQGLRERFEVVKKLGQGTYGKVQLAIKKETKQEVAIKTIRKAKIENEQDLLRIRREIQIMSSIQHPHIIHIYEVFENCEKIVLVMQYASGGELYDYLGCHRKLPEKEARRIFRQIAAAIYYCHKNKICHRDLKLENILLDDKGNAKIADFGLSNVFDERKTLHTFCGSPLYASPEIVKGTPYCGPEVDCWSLGVLLYTLVYGAMPFDGSNFKRLVKQISEGDYYEPKLKSRASGIIRRLLTVDVMARATIKDICNDEWVNETYDHSLLKVANDMACLTPVSLNALPLLTRKSEPSTSATKFNMIRNKTLPTKNNILEHKLDSIVTSTQNELMKSGAVADGQNIKPSNLTSELISSFPYYLSRRMPFVSHPVRATLNNTSASSPKGSSKAVAEDLGRKDFNATENLIAVNGNPKSMDTPPKSVKGNTTGKELSTATEILSAPTVASENHDLCQETPEIGKEASDRNTPKDQTEELLEKDQIVCDYSNVKMASLSSNIPNFDVNSKQTRQSAVEQFRAWRANLDKPRKSDPDSILPIFDVTSIIPKRSNERKYSLNNEQQKEECKNTRYLPKNNIAQANYFKQCSSLKAVGKNDLIAMNNVNRDSEVDGKAEAANACLTDCSINKFQSLKRNELTASKERKEVIEFLNQVCSQKKLSSELKNHFVTALRTESTVDETKVVKSADLSFKDQTDEPQEEKQREKDRILEDQMFSNKNTIESEINEKCVISKSSGENLESSSKSGLTDSSSEVVAHEPDSENTQPNSTLPEEKMPILEEKQVMSNFKVSENNSEKGAVCSRSTETHERPVVIQENSKASLSKLSRTDIKHNEDPSIVNAAFSCSATRTQSGAINNFPSHETVKQQEQLAACKISSANITPREQEANSLDQSIGSSCSTSEKDVQSSSNESSNQMQRAEQKRKARSHSIHALKTRSYSVDNDERISDLEKILRRPRKYSLCALLAASFEIERLATTGRTRRDSDTSKKLPGKVTIPRSFDPSSESEASTPVEKKEIVLIPSITVAENKQKIETKIEKVKMSALSMKPRRKSEAGTRRKLKKYTRSCTDVLQSISQLGDSVNVLQSGSFQRDEKENSGNSRKNGDFVAADNNTDCEVRHHYGSIGFLDQEEVASNQEAETLETVGSPGYVPITRCCKKINFPPKYSENIEYNNGTFRHENCAMSEYLSMPENSHNQEVNQALPEPEPRTKNLHLRSVRHTKKKIISKSETKSETNGKEVALDETLLNDEGREEDSSPSKNLRSTESLESSSLEKDSSDNDDELDSMIFDTNVEGYESGDLWKFLKTINNDLSCRLKKAKRNSMKSMYSRSKSQECKMSEERCVLEKSLTRSRSKEEKQDRQSSGMISHSSQETCDSSLSDFNQSPSAEFTHSFAYVKDNRKIFDSKTDFHRNEFFKDSLKAKYYSLSNLNESQSFLYDNNLRDRCDTTDFESCGTVAGSDDIHDGWSLKCNNAFANGELQLTNPLLLYGTMRPKRLTNNDRSQSHMLLNRSGNIEERHKENLKALSHIELQKSDKEHSSTVRNKALSDLDISYRNAASNPEPSTTISYDEKDRGSLRFSKSLGSKLNLEPRSILLDSPKKQHAVGPRNKLKDDIIHRKRGRKVSFIGDTIKDEHKNFALESIAKAQMALNEADRNFTDTEVPEEKGTLLEALKTQGYKSLISQRLQKNEEAEIEPLNRRYSLACLTNPALYNSEEPPLTFLHSKSLIDPMEHAKHSQWNKNVNFHLDDTANNFNEMDYTDLLGLNGYCDSRIYNRTDMNWLSNPNLWLHQNVETFRPNRSLNEIVLPKWEEADFNLWQNDAKSQRLTSSNDTCNNDFGHIKRASAELDKYTMLDSDFEQSRNTESPIEKLCMKIKALKNRCHQKSFDESAISKVVSSDLIENTDAYLNRAKHHESDTGSYSQEAAGGDKPEESVSDRIWRKSFYSRFNDTPTLRRRKSMLFDPECSRDPLLLKALKLRNTPQNAETMFKTPEKEPSSAPRGKNSERPVSKTAGNHVDAYLARNSDEQNIPNHIACSSTEDMSKQINGGE